MEVEQDAGREGDGAAVQVATSRCCSNVHDIILEYFVTFRVTTFML